MNTFRIAGRINADWIKRLPEHEGEIKIHEKLSRQMMSTKGGPGSGHHGHAGRPGKRGGSAPGSPSHQARGKQWIDSLTSDEVRVLKSWGRSGYNIRKLQSGETEKIGYNSSPHIADMERKRAEEALPVWNGLIDKGIPYKGTVYRGLADVPKDVVSQWRQEGTEIELRNDQSSSKDKEYIRRFTGRGAHGSSAVVWIVNQRSGVDLFEQTSVWYGNPQTGHVSEREVILRKGAKYRVTGWKYVVSRSSTVFREYRSQSFPWDYYFEDTEYGKDNWPEGWSPQQVTPGHFEIEMEEVE